MTPTAEEMFQANPILPEGVTRQACIAFMRAFAKLHVEEALKQASEQACAEWNNQGYESVYLGIDKLSIMEAYPLENVK